MVQNWLEKLEKRLLNTRENSRVNNTDSAMTMSG